MPRKKPVSWKEALRLKAVVQAIKDKDLYLIVDYLDHEGKPCFDQYRVVDGTAGRARAHQIIDNGYEVLKDGSVLFIPPHRILSVLVSKAGRNGAQS
jgi:hypothetical protein